MYRNKEMRAGASATHADNTVTAAPMRTYPEKEIEKKLVGFICRTFMVEPGEFSLDESLVDQGVIDSFGLVETSAFMEREFNIKVAETDMNRANFGSVRKMITYIGRMAGYLSKIEDEQADVLKNENRAEQLKEGKNRLRQRFINRTQGHVLGGSIHE